MVHGCHDLSFISDKGVGYTILRGCLVKDNCTFPSVEGLTLNIELKACLIHFQRQEHDIMKNMEKIQDCKMVETGSSLKVRMV